MRTDEIPWEDLPPADRNLFIPIASPKVGEAHHLVVLSNGLVGVQTHYVHNRTRPCVGTHNQCEGCAQGRATRWKGYLAAWSRSKERLVIAELTMQAVADNMHLLLKKRTDLRGWWLTLTRAGRRVNSPVRAKFEEPPAQQAELPACFDLKAALCRIWQRRLPVDHDGLADAAERE
jgi:hypothetical protein